MKEQSNSVNSQGPDGWRGESESGSGRWRFSHLFETMGARGDRIAVKMAGRPVTYAQLDAHVRQLCDRLRLEGIREGERIGIYMDKSPAYVATILAVLKSGMVYVPLDAAGPVKRTAYILAHCGVHTVVCNCERRMKNFRSIHSSGGPRKWIMAGLQHGDTCGDEGTAVEQPDSASSASARYGAGDAAVLYTSGSTAMPKGAIITRANIEAFVTWALKRFSLKSDDRFISHAPFHFDLSLFDLFAAFAAGASVVLIPYQKSNNPQYLVKHLAEEKITIWQSVPSVLSLMAEFGAMERFSYGCLRYVLFAGERMPVRFLKRLLIRFPNAEFCNIYGATETNDTFMYQVRRCGIVDPLPIGSPLPYVRYLIVGPDGCPVSGGDRGELLVDAPTVMRGYWPNDEDGRSDVFIRINGRRFFRTKDIVHQDADGSLHLHGRTDDIIKSGGFRVNLLEIERCLLEYPQILEAAVIAIPDTFLGNRIGALIRARPGVKIPELELREFCSRGLPRHMIPHEFRMTNRTIEKTASGKTDKSHVKRRWAEQTVIREERDDQGSDQKLYHH